MSPQNKKRCALVVDDQSNWRLLLSQLLEDDFDVTPVVSLQEAINAVLKKTDSPYHVVVTDIRLQDDQQGNEDGMHLAELLNRLGNRTKVIVVTGYPTLNTVKRALGPLSVYDYLEKVPENREPFDGENFRKIVCQAAEKAESERPDGFTLPRLWVLLIGKKMPWRDKVAKLLRDHLYDVDVVDDATQLMEDLEKNKKVYNLVIFHEEVTQQQEDFFSILDQRLPDVKKIMFTDQEIEPVVRLMQEQVIMNVFTVQDGQYDRTAFEETLQRAFSPEATRYAVAKIFDPASPGQPLLETEKLSPGKKYRLELTLQNARQPGSVGVWLLPKAEKRGGVQFKVFIYAPGMRLEPNAEAYWEIPSSRQIQPFSTDVIPRIAGNGMIMIELEQDNGWVWRLTRQVVVDRDQ
jgi:ActR/RegA family two-component response regulator